MAINNDDDEQRGIPLDHQATSETWGRGEGVVEDAIAQAARRIALGEPGQASISECTSFSEAREDAPLEAGPALEELVTLAVPGVSPMMAAYPAWLMYKAWAGGYWSLTPEERGEIARRMAIIGDIGS